MSLRRFNPYYRWVFPRLLDRVSKVVAPERDQLLSRAKGVVLEVGAGTGTSFQCYQNDVSRVVALEPDAGVMLRAGSLLRRLPDMQRDRVKLMMADAMNIPLANNSVDTVVCFLVLCSVAKPEQALAEIYRVLKPGGQLLFFEHVLSDNVAVQRWQHRLNPFWHRCAGGCQLNRETEAIIAQAGFKLQTVRRYQHAAFPLLVRQLVTGVGVVG